MRIERETEVTIKVRIGYVWPDDFQDEFGKTYLSEDDFRSGDLIEAPVVAKEILEDTVGTLPNLFEQAEVTIQDLGIVQE